MLFIKRRPMPTPRAIYLFLGFFFSSFITVVLFIERSSSGLAVSCWRNTTLPSFCSQFTTAWPLDPGKLGQLNLGVMPRHLRTALMPLLAIQKPGCSGLAFAGIVGHQQDNQRQMERHFSSVAFQTSTFCEWKVLDSCAKEFRMIARPSSSEAISPMVNI